MDTQLRSIDGLSAVAGDYDALACDAWGVIHNGRSLFPGAADTLMRFRETRGPVVIITNAPKPWTVIPGQLERLGLPREAWDAIVTSGDATRALITERLPAPAHHIGPPDDNPLFEQLGVSFTPLEDAGFIICTGFFADNYEPEAYRPLLEKAAERGLEMVCANPDIVVNWGGKIIYCAGALAQIYLEVGGGVVYGGKPHPPIYDLTLSAFERINGAPMARERVLGVGDGPQTDILGANQAGFGSVLVTGPNGISDDNRVDASAAQPLAKMASLTW